MATMATMATVATVATIDECHTGVKIAVWGAAPAAPHVLAVQPLCFLDAADTA